MNSATDIRIMKFSFTVVLVILFSVSLQAQWRNLGLYGPNLEMTGDMTGYMWQHEVGPTPSQGTKYFLYRTLNDWHGKELFKSGGGQNYYCCFVTELAFLSDSSLVMPENFSGIYAYTQTLDAGETWSYFATGSSTNFQLKGFQMVSDSLGFAIGILHGENRRHFYSCLFIRLLWQVHQGIR